MAEAAIGDRQAERLVSLRGRFGEPATGDCQGKDERRFARVAVLCPARILIGNRQYGGYIHNISAGGAKLPAISAIRRSGIVIRRLPDLPVLRCRLSWSDTYNAGVAFEMPLAADSFAKWLRSRVRKAGDRFDAAPGLADLELLQ